MEPAVPRLILASSSQYRRELLSRLGLPFETGRPDVDETPRHGESPAMLAVRLARAKAAALASPEGWAIGSDQVAELDGAPLGKPGNFAAARGQLSAMSGRQVRFHTAVCLAGPNGGEAVDLTEVRFRKLDADEIERYLQAESPLDCAGSFKCEGLGISLFEAIDSKDPTALIGLPLIALARLLRDAGFQVP